MPPNQSKQSKQSNQHCPPDIHRHFRRPDSDSSGLVFNIRLLVAYDDRLSETRAINGVLAALIEGIEGCIFPLWVSGRDGDDYMVSLCDLEIFP